MPKIDRWIIATKSVPVFDTDLIKQIEDLNGQVGGGWHEIHQHVNVNENNKEKIEELLARSGYKVTAADDPGRSHPEMH